jgi:hypothetical protein
MGLFLRTVLPRTDKAFKLYSSFISGTIEFFTYIQLQIYLQIDMINFSVVLVSLSDKAIIRSWLSRPLLQFSMWRYWFRLSHYVYGCNRSFAPILRQSRWSLLYDVYWLALMMVNSQRDRNTWTQFRIRIVLFFFEQQNKELMWNESNQQTNKWSNNEQNKWTTITYKPAQKINKWQIMMTNNNWHKHICTI